MLDWFYRSANQVALELKPVAAKSDVVGAAPPVAAVAGGKGVGKSTLCRLLANSLLSCAACPHGVALLDADCGQVGLCS